MKNKFSERQLDALLEIEAKIYGISKRKMKREIIETYFVKAYVEMARTVLQKNLPSFNEIFEVVIKNQ